MAYRTFGSSSSSELMPAWGGTGTGTIQGTSGDDTLTGTSGNDTISGLGGNDTIAGGAGADAISGGDGNDTLYSGDVSPTWIWPYQTDPYTSPVLDHGTDVDTLQGGAGDDAIFAGYGDNVDGGGQDIYGDILFISFLGASEGLTVDFRQTTQTVGGATITGIENIGWVEGTNFDDYINVDAASENGYSPFNVVQGMDGNDTLIAGTYTGLLDGGAGNDVIDGTNSYYLYVAQGGDGNDTIYTGGTPTTVTYGGSGDDTIFSANRTYGGDGNDTITLGFSYYGPYYNQAYGEAGDDTLTGSASNDQLSGGRGADTLSGGGGSDLFLFTAGDGHDLITDFSGDDGLQVNGYGEFQSISQVGSDVIVAFSDSDIVTFANADVANVQAAISFVETDDILNGGPSDETLNGYGGNDTISGGGGADTVIGGDGNDLLFADGVGSAPFVAGELGLDGKTDHDVLIAGTGDDLLSVGYGDDADGGDGFDTLRLDLEQMTSAVTLDTAVFGSGPAVFGGGTIQHTEQVEYLRTTNFGDHITIAEQANPVTVDAAGGDDFIISTGGPVHVLAGAGDDYVEIRAGAAQVFAQVFGGDGNDVVNIASGQGFIDGGDGDDIVYTGTSYDTIKGGAGSDTVSYAHWAAGAFVNLGAQASTDGDSFESIENVEGSDFADDIIGDSGANVLSGGGGNDALNGDAGNDTLDGGAGNDTMAGGTGNDTYYVDSASDSVTEASAAGNDTVHAAITYTLGNNVENGILDGTSAINLTGNTLANSLTGNSAANILDGGAGSDTLTGSGGVDTFVYRTGGGRDVITDFSAGEAINIYGYTAAQSVVQSGLNVVVTLASGNTITVNNSTVANVSAALHFQTSGGGGGGGTPGTITGTSGADTLNGTSGNDTINGLGGNDTLSGSGGNDILDGGTGNDTMRGGTGNDIFYVDSTSDVVTELSGQGSDEVRSTVSYTLGSNLEKATALGSGAINLTGNTLANTLTGNSGANIVKGNGGADTIKGGLGNDTLSGGSGADVFVYSDVNSGADKITDFVSGSDKINLHAFGMTSANVHTAVSGSNLVISVDADHNGTNDFTITLVGVTHIAAADYVF